MIIRDFSSSVWQKLPVANWSEILGQALESYDPAVLLQSHGRAEQFENCWAFGARKILRADGSESIKGLREQFTGCWGFGYLSFDLKNAFIQTRKSRDDLKSENPDRFGFAELCFFEPEYIFCEIKNEVFAYGAESTELALRLKDKFTRNSEPDPVKLSFEAALQKSKYIEHIEQIRSLIKAGDFYEMNYCFELISEAKIAQAYPFYQRFSNFSAAPFSAFFQDKKQDLHLFCASPERYLQKAGSWVISQPIKGTIARDLEDPVSNELLGKSLLNSEKDRAENVMIVDLVRNDFYKVCEAGSVSVPELFGLHQFQKVQHLISTVEGKLENGNDIFDLIAASFPMGSMTGAPKTRVLQWIEELENFKRGLYSGAVGYLTPSGDADFNVVIRSMIYQASSSQLSYPVGGAITWDSRAESEWEECLVKAKPIEELLQ
jgi:para-aminobenzoate synthetase component 1